MTTIGFSGANGKSAVMSGMLPRLLTAVVAANIAATAAAEPVVSNIDFGDSLEHGAVVSVEGSGFGAGDKGKPAMWHRVDGEESYTELGHGAKVPMGSGYVWNGGRPSNPVMINKNKEDQRHPYSESNYESPGGNSFLSDPILANSSTPDELFLSYWVKFDRDPYERNNSASHKFVRIWGGGSSDMRISWVGWGLTVTNSNQGGSSQKIAYSLPNANRSVWGAEKWHLHEVWVSPKEGRAQTFVDGKLRNDFQDSSSQYIKTSHPNGPRVALLGFNPSHGEGHVGGAKFHMDDIVVNNSRARVLLSKSENWDDSTNHEYQPPIDWSEDKININLNYGALHKDQTYYLYVVNADGEVNADGFPLECLECPNKTELHVE